MGDSRTSKDSLADEVTAAWVEVEKRLHGSERFPHREFRGFVTAVKSYAAAARGDRLIHRTVVNAMRSCVTLLQHYEKGVPGDVLHEADRIDRILFAGYDPHFEGDEPPGL